MSSSDGSQAEAGTSNHRPIRLDGVRAGYGQRTVFQGLSCGFPQGKISVILGGSGSGKSTLLRLIGGLLRPQAGAIFIDDQNIAPLYERRLHEVRRKLGMMFQGGALLDSYTVFENLALPLREHTRLNEPQVADEVHARLKAVGLADVDHLLPNELSGGMVRRVGLARAIIRNPTILLCDEPFSGLDPASIKRIETLLVSINRDLGITMVVVSHDIPSTMRMADHLVLLLPGRVVEGPPRELACSTDPQVAEFLNEGLDRGTSPIAQHGGPAL